MIYNPGQLRRDSSLYTSQARKPIRLAYLLYKKTIDIDQHLAQKVIVDIPKFKEIKILQESYFNHTDLTRSFRLLKLLKRGLTDIHKNQLYEILLLTKLTNSFSVAARNSITILTYTDYELIDKDIENIILSNVDLGHLCMINSSFKNSSLNIVNFSNSQLFRLNFQNCDLENAWFGIQTVFKHQEDFIRSISISLCGLYLASGGNDGIIHIWNMKSFEKEISLSGHTSKLKKLVFTNNYLFSSSDDSYVFIWMIGDWKMVRYIEVKVAYRIVTLAVDPNEKFIVCSDEIGNLSKWCVISAELVTICNMGFVVKCFVLTKDSVIFADIKDRINFISYETFESFKILQESHHLESLKVSNCSNYLFVLCSSESRSYIYIWNLKRNNKIYEYSTLELIRTLEISPCGAYLAIGNKFSSVWLFDIKYQKSKKIDWNENKVRALCFSSCGKYVCGCINNLLVVWGIQQISMMEWK